LYRTKSRGAKARVKKQNQTGGVDPVSMMAVTAVFAFFQAILHVPGVDAPGLIKKVMQLSSEQIFASAQASPAFINLKINATSIGYNQEPFQNLTPSASTFTEKLVQTAITLNEKVNLVSNNPSFWSTQYTSSIEHIPHASGLATTARESYNTPEPSVEHFQAFLTSNVFMLTLGLFFLLILFKLRIFKFFKPVRSHHPGIRPHESPRRISPVRSSPVRSSPVRSLSPAKRVSVTSSPQKTRKSSLFNEYETVVVDTDKMRTYATFINALKNFFVAAPSVKSATDLKLVVSSPVLALPPTYEESEQAYHRDGPAYAVPAYAVPAYGGRRMSCKKPRKLLRKMLSKMFRKTARY
jgi:hypothetical protein